MKIFFRKIFLKRKRGFTLVEILAVVIILGILAAISVPTYTRLIRRSRVADGLNVLELLASAQDKYYVLHGVYATELERLNIPLYNIHITDTPPYTTIETVNFNYNKGQDKTSNCLFAESRNARMVYTLVKNYKTKATVGCLGESCRELTDYVGPVEDLDKLCPAGQEECKLTNEICIDQGFAGKHPDKCECLPKDNPTGCTPEDDTPWFATGGKCTYPAEPSAPIEETCGIIKARKVCNTSTGLMEEQNECVQQSCPAGQILNKDCDCVPQAGCTDPKPECSPTHSQYGICDPCPEAPSIDDIISEWQQTGTLPENTCWHCGTSKGQMQAVCNENTGQWECGIPLEGDPYCENSAEGSITNFASFCDGDGAPGNKCGVATLTNVQCTHECNGAPYYECGRSKLVPEYGSCELRLGNDCYTGQIGDECTTQENTAGRLVCDACKWVCKDTN